MEESSKSLKLMKNYITKKNYDYLGLSSHFLNFDEYVAFMEMLITEEFARKMIMKSLCSTAYVI